MVDGERGLRMDVAHGEADARRRAFVHAGRVQSVDVVDRHLPRVERHRDGAGLVDRRAGRVASPQHVQPFIREVVRQIALRVGARQGEQTPVATGAGGERDPRGEGAERPAVAAEEAAVLVPRHEVPEARLLDEEDRRQHEDVGADQILDHVEHRGPGHEVVAPAQVEVQVGRPGDVGAPDGRRELGEVGADSARRRRRRGPGWATAARHDGRRRSGGGRDPLPLCEPRTRPPI